VKVETATRLIKNATSLGGVETTMESRHPLGEGDASPEGLLASPSGSRTRRAVGRPRAGDRRA
jgi:hypothetical protein